LWSLNTLFPVKSGRLTIFTRRILLLHDQNGQLRGKSGI
jgi:hypothetical protein